MPTDLDHELRRIAQALVGDNDPVLPPPWPLEIEASPVPAASWRLALLVGAAAVVTVGAGLAMTVGGGELEDGASSATTGDAATASPSTIRPMVLDAGAEISADGSVSPITSDRFDALRWQGAVRLGDGRLVLLGTKDLMPGVERDDDAFVEGLAMPLVVVGADGAVQLERDVRVVGEDPYLVGADDQAAHLQRTVYPRDSYEVESARLVRHDLATGVETLVTDLAEPLLHVDYRAGHYVGDIGIGGSDGNRDCVVVDVDLAAGTTARTTPLADCSMILGTAIAPDGTRAGIVYETNFSDVSVAVVDLATDTVTATYGPLGPARAFRQLVTYQGVDWPDDTTLRVALNRLADDPNSMTVGSDGVPVEYDDLLPRDESLLIEELAV